jgi:hypothetical protein
MKCFLISSHVAKLVRKDLDAALGSCAWARILSILGRDLGASLDVFELLKMFKNY